MRICAPRRAVIKDQLAQYRGCFANLTPNAIMSQIQQWARSKRPLAVESGVDPCDGISFSWSGIKLVVDLVIDTSPVDVDTVRATLILDDVTQPSKRPRDITNEPGSTQESSPPKHDDTEAIKDTLNVNHQNDDMQQPFELEKCGIKDEPDRNWTHCTWPDWGEPLPPEEDDDEMNIDYDGEIEKNQASRKVVTFSDAIEFVEASSLQEERETGSFSYGGSSDDELEQGTDRVTINSDDHSRDLPPSRVSSTEKEAACHLLELRNESNCADSKEKGFESSGMSEGGKGEFCDPSHDLEKLSELLEKLYAATPELSIVSDSQGSVSSDKLGTWIIQVSKDSGRFRMKRIKRENNSGLDDEDDENDVLDRPPWKRQYKSISKLL